MTSEDGTNAEDQTGGLGPDQVSAPPLAHQGATLDNPLVASLIDDKPPVGGDAEETALNLDPIAQDTGTSGEDPSPAATADKPGESPDEPGKPPENQDPPQQDPYLKQLSQQLATLTNQVGELKGSIGNQQAAAQDPDATAEDQAKLQDAQEDLGNVLEELATLEQALEDRDELDGVEPGDLKSAIKLMGGLAKRVEAAEQRAQKAEQAAQASANQSGVEAFFKTEAQKHSLPADKLEGFWTQASQDAVKYLGDHAEGTPEHDLARNYAQTRYGEYVEAAKAQTDTAQQAPAPAPDPVKPPAPAGNQPRHDPTGTVTQPAGSRPAAPSGKRDTKSIINGLITPD